MMSEVRVRVLFVCMGNICRSPTAEGVFRQLVRERGLAGVIETDSAGTGDWHAGEAPDPRAQAMARKHGIDISGQRARVVRRTDFERFDYVCAMDRQNLNHLLAMCPRELQGRVRLLCDFAEELCGQAVPDPFYGGEDGFEEVYRLVRRASEGLIDEIVRAHLPADR